LRFPRDDVVARLFVEFVRAVERLAVFVRFLDMEVFFEPRGLFDEDDAALFDAALTREAADLPPAVFRFAVERRPPDGEATTSAAAPKAPIAAPVAAPPSMSPATSIALFINLAPVLRGLVEVRFADDALFFDLREFVLVGMFPPKDR
jgi:hypothetical protein